MAAAFPATRGPLLGDRSHPEVLAPPFPLGRTGVGCLATGPLGLDSSLSPSEPLSHRLLRRRCVWSSGSRLCVRPHRATLQGTAVLIGFRRNVAVLTSHIRIGRRNSLFISVGVVCWTDKLSQRAPLFIHYCLHYLSQMKVRSPHSSPC